MNTIATNCPVCNWPTTWTVPHRLDGFPSGITWIQCGHCAYRKEIFIDTPHPKNPHRVQRHSPN